MIASSPQPVRHANDGVSRPAHLGARDHGGNLDDAITRFGGEVDNWIDLSTGINRRPYPVPEIPPHSWRRLPTQSDVSRLTAAAARAYDTQAAILPLAGAQAAIQLVPRLARTGQAAILAPTYNEHSASLEHHGWRVREVTSVDQIAGADLAVVVNPNNPDGRAHRPEALLDIARTVGLLVVDESFTDATPELSLAARADMPGLVVLRSFGKFYGLAGLRLGFAIGAQETISRLASDAGPWQVSGPAIAIGCAALADVAWRHQTAARLADDVRRLDSLAQRAGWSDACGTHLFRLYTTVDAAATQDQLARHHIWTRRFPWSPVRLRLGLPGCEEEWSRLATALASA